MHAETDELRSRDTRHDEHASLHELLGRPKHVPGDASPPPERRRPHAQRDDGREQRRGEPGPAQDHDRDRAPRHDSKDGRAWPE